MKLNKTFIGILLLSTMALVSCKKDWLDVNQDPETTSNVDPEFLIYTAQSEYATNRTTEIGLSGSMWTQLWASGASASVFRNPERYIFSVFTTGNTWRNHYPNSQKNLKFAIDIAENPESGPAKPNIAAQAKVMRALIFYTTTMLWGDVPYSQAINSDIDAPKFDRQEDILNGLLGELDAAIAQFDPNDVNVANDHYFAGNVPKWIAFAKSLKFRILMTMVDSDPSKQSEIQAMLAEGGMISSNAEAAEYGFYNESGHYNPNWNVLNTFAGGQNLFYFASEVTVETMKKYNDPRLNIYFFPGNDTTGIRGVEPGTSGDYDKDARISLNVVRPDAPERVFTYTEQLFLEAEAEFRFGSAVNADAKMRAAITNSMQYWGVDQTAIDAYLVTLPNLATQTPAQGLQLIAEQHWIASIDKPIEAWTNWRRLEFPALSLPDGATLGDIVRRLPYPPDEVNSNPNAPTQPSLDTKMWFDK
ncbi:SusD/RagB family nutrient-binding outer membrane lipoprotein [Luteibaculum oceani]|uniref:SusD/RagB family nutrient-binding outer membrane lipoprotein n=1 Tax=Luteibaculum oceani TaxID=1294296 RepID=A0A5C6V1K2_9FLAO|nr:SusD/RagB family nutrient-binding outer membrane lipoprotein [Luteibaculum oceani]TXC78864.1 SusD/RagB family nutrient-binding outer membrane lipoprotein [Luteibaculum oceani]